MVKEIEELYEKTMKNRKFEDNKITEESKKHDDKKDHKVDE